MGFLTNQKRKRMTKQPRMISDFAYEMGKHEEQSRIIKLLEGKELGCPCGCGKWLDIEPVITLIKGETNGGSH